MFYIQDNICQDNILYIILTIKFHGGINHLREFNFIVKNLITKATNDSRRAIRVRVIQRDTTKMIYQQH